MDIVTGAGCYTKTVYVKFQRCFNKGGIDMKKETIIVPISKTLKNRLEAAAKRRKISVDEFIIKTMKARMNGWYKPH